MRRKIWLTLIVLLVLVIGRAAWVLYTFDEQSYIQSIQEEIEESLGLQLQVHGQVRKSIFPRPRLFLSQISCYKKGAKDPVWTASEVVFQTNWKSLLKAYMRIYHVAIINPHIYISPNPAGQSQSWEDTILRDNDFLFKYLKTLSIKNGSITYQTQNKTYQITQLNGNLLPTKDNDLIHWEGSGIYHDLTYASTFLLKQSDGSAFPWSLTLTTPDKEDHININGRISDLFKNPRISGTLDVSSTSIGSLLSASDLYRHLPNALDTPLRLSAEFTCAEHKLDVTQVALRIGEGKNMAHLVGTLTYNYGAQTSANGLQAQLHMDGSEHLLWPLISLGNFSSYNFFQWLKNKSPNLNIHVEAENTSLFDLPVTRLGADITYRQPDVYIKNLSIQGLLSATGEGVWSVSREDSALDLAMQASIPNLANFVRRYPLAFSSYVDLNHTFPVSIACDFHKSLSQLAFYNLKIGLPDQASITGEVVKTDGQGTSARLNLSKLNLADFVHYFEFKKTGTPLQTLQQALDAVAKAQIWNAFPMHLELTGQDITLKQTPIKAAQLSADIERQTVKINQFSASLPGDMEIKNVKGELQKDVSGKVRMHEIHYQLNGPKLADLGISADVFAWISGPAQITGLLNGTAERIQTSSSLKTADVSALYEGIISQQAPYYDAIIQASSPSFEPMARILWKRSNPFTLLTGRTEVSMQVRVDDEHMILNDMHMRVGDLQLDGHANLAKTDVQYISLSAPQLDMRLFYLPEVKDILHMKLSGLKTWDVHFETPELVTWNNLIIRQANTHFLLQPTQWNLLKLTGFINHGEVQATGQLQKTQDDAALSAQIRLTGAHMNNVAVPPMQLQSGILSMDLQMNNPQVDNAAKIQGVGSFTLSQATFQHLNINEFISQVVRLPLSQQFTQDRPPIVKALKNGTFLAPEIKGRFEIKGPTFSIPELTMTTTDAVIKAKASGENKTLLGTLWIRFATPIDAKAPFVSLPFAYGTQLKSTPDVADFYDFLVQNKVSLRKRIFSFEQRKHLEELNSERKARIDKSNEGRAEMARSLQQQIQESYQKIQKIRTQRTFNETAENLYQQLEAEMAQLDALVKASMTANQLSLVQQQTAACTRLMRDIRRAQEGDPVFFAQLRTQKVFAEATALFKTLAPLYRKHPSYQNEHLYKQAQQAMATIQKANSLAQKALKLENVEEKTQTIKAQLNLLQQIEKRMKALSQ